MDATETPARSRHQARRIAIAVGAAVAAIAVILALTVGTDPLADQRRSQLLGKDAPGFDLPTLGGQRVRLADLAGKSVIVNFWNTWCIPCRQEHPNLVAFYRQHASDPDFVMIGIVRDDTESAVRKYVPKNNVEWIVAFDPGGEAALSFGTRGQPETYAISPDGIIAGSQWGPATADNLEAMLGAARGQR